MLKAVEMEYWKSNDVNRKSIISRSRAEDERKTGTIGGVAELYEERKTPKGREKIEEKQQQKFKSERALTIRKSLAFFSLRERRWKAFNVDRK